MFSGFRFRNRSADPTQAVGGKRPNENDNSRYEEIEQLPEKMGRFELDDSDESSVWLPSDLENFVPKHVRKHAGDKVIKKRVPTDKPVPGNVDKPPAVDIYINELIKETVSGKRTLNVDRFLTNIQEGIRNALGLVSDPIVVIGC